MADPVPDSTRAPCPNADTAFADLLCSAATVTLEPRYRVGVILVEPRRTSHESALQDNRAADSFSAVWMKLTIHHRTTYRYPRCVVLLPHHMMLGPRSSHDVAVLARSLVYSPAAQLDWTQDVFDNLIATGTFAEPTSELVITSNPTVEQLAEARPV